MVKSYPTRPFVQGFRSNNGTFRRDFSPKLIVAVASVAKRFGFAEAAGIGVTERQEHLAICQHPIEAVIGIRMNGITLFAAVPDAMDPADALPDGLRRIFDTHEMLHHPIKENFTVIFTPDVAFPGSE